MDENKPQQNDTDIKVLRTYTSDMADAVRINEMSVIKIALAEKEKREREEIYKKAEGTNTSKTFLVIGGIILIAVAIFGSYFIFQKTKEKKIPPQITTNIETIITYDSKSNIDVTNITGISDLISEIKKGQDSNPSLIKALFFIKNNNGITENISSSNFLSLIKTSAPGALIRSLSDKYLFGKYSNSNAINEKDKYATFLIFQTNNYTQTYASMLDWEKTMLKDLFTIFEITIPESENSLFEKPWKDLIVNNKDVRVLYGDTGEGILYYVFVNKDNLVIANNLETLKEVMSRIIIKNTQPL
ncbi:MAG: hypothetical protein WCT42_00320 [Candidatus Paceibacterota bacterium]